MPTFDITTIDVTSSTSTEITGLNASGELVGRSGLHLFVAENGTVTTLGLPSLITSIVSINGINASGEIVGNDLEAARFPTPQVQHGFVDINGTITTLNVPGATANVITGVNDSGEIVGRTNTGHGFVDINGVFTTIDAPGFTSTNITGVNDSGELVGSYSDGSASHGFVDVNGTFTTIDPTGSAGTSIAGVNNSGEVFGTYFDSSFTSHGFVDINGTITTIDPAGSTRTSITEVNNSGEIVGFYADSTGITHGFVDINGVFTTIDPPGSTSSDISGVNDSGEIVGSYFDSTGEHGFTAIEGPPSRIITGAQANQATTDAKAIDPFAGIVIAPPSLGTPTETVTVRPNTTANGTLSDPNAASDGSTISNGVFTVTGTATAVTTALEGLVFTPAEHQVPRGQSVTTGFEISVTNTLGQLDLTKSDDTTSVIATALNNPPTLISPVLSYAVAEGQTLQNLYAQLLANAQDVDAGDQAQLTVSTLGLSNSAGFLHFDAADRMLTYTADGFNAAKPVDSFSYTISDPHGATDTGTVDVTVTGPALPTQVGSAGADRLTADGSGHRLIGGDGNDKLTGHGENQLIFGGRGDDTITADGNNSTIYGGPGTNGITLDGNRETVVLQQGGVDQISGFELHNGDVLDLSQALVEAQINLAGDFSQLGSFVHVSSAGRDANLSFGGSSLAVLHGVGAGVTLDTLIQDGSVRIN